MAATDEMIRGFEQLDTTLSDEEDDAVGCQAFLCLYIKKHKLGFVNFVQKTLKEAINDAKADKPLILYFHNEEEKFSINFISLIKDPEVVHSFGKKFDILAWDLNNKSIHHILATAIRNNFSELEDVCSKMLEMLNGREPGIFLITNTVNFVKIPLLDDKLTKKALLDLDKLAATLIKCNELSTVVMDHVLNRPGQFQQDVCNVYSDDNKKVLNLDDIQFIGSDATKFQQSMSKKMAGKKYLIFNKSSTDCLKDTIAYVMHRTCNYNSSLALQGAINNIFQRICKEPKYTEDDSINLSIIFNSVHLNGENATIQFPIFVLSRCEGGKNSCRRFIDHESRIYKTWGDYKTETKFPHCEMILPREGQYNVDLSGKVLLETYNRDVDWISVVDTFAKTLHHTSILHTIPYVTATSLAYLAFRNAYTIYDRHQHGQDVSFTNPESRDAYLFMASSTVGLAAHAATSTKMQNKLSTKTKENFKFASTTAKVVTAANQGASLAKSKFNLTQQDFEKLSKELETLSRYIENLCDGFGWEMKGDLPYKRILDLISPLVTNEDEPNSTTNLMHLKQTVAARKVKLACKCGGYYYRTL